MSKITLDDYKAMVGQEVGVSRWFEVAQGRIDGFADVTEDHQFIPGSGEAAPTRMALEPFGNANFVHGGARTVIALENALRGAPRRTEGLP
ncbi:MAG: hypothetical protein ACRD2A_02010 [Vicinamibacterales bacterium]